MAARRTVSVSLDVKTAAARKDIQATVKDVDKLIASSEAAGGSLDDMAADAKQAGRKLDDMAGDAAQAARATDKLAASTRISGRNLREMKGELGRLDRQIDATVAHLKLLEHQFATTGDRSLLKQIAADQSLIAKMRKIRQDLTPAAESGVTEVGKSASGAFSMLPSEIKGIAIAGLVAAAGAATPIIGAAIGGAVMGGVGTGGVVGGIVAAAQDARVKSAFGEIGGGLAAALKGIGQPFVGPLLHEVDTLAVTAHRAIDILHDGMAQLAPVIRPLALGIDGFVEALGPGLKQAFAAAAPAMRAIANELPEIGAALSDMFSAISDEGDGATMGLLAMLHAIEWLIRATGSFVSTMSGIFEWLVRTGNATTEWALKVVDVAEAFAILGGPIAMSAVDAARSHLTALNTESDHLIAGLNAAKDPSKDFARNLGDTAESADDAAQKIRDLNDAIDTLFGKQMSWDEAQIRVREGMRDLVDELTHGKRTLKENTIEGDKNRAAILNQIAAIEDLRTAYYNQTGDLAGANAKYEAHLDELQKVLIKRGYEKDAVLAIIDAYRQIPAKASTTVETPGLVAAQSRLNSIEHTLQRLDGSHATATVLIQELHREDARLYRRWGGITEHAASGLLRDPAIYSTRSPARYAFAEPATGGEAFIPKNGPYGRAMSIMSQAAGWYGASVVPRGGGATTRVQVEVVGVQATGNALIDAIVSGIQFKVRTVGAGDVNYLAGRR